MSTKGVKGIIEVALTTEEGVDLQQSIATLMDLNAALEQLKLS